MPSMFKRLRYPFSISKTALVAVGSPHTWPPLLAALTWLVELLNYRERALQVAPTGGMGESSEGVWLSEERDLSGDREFFEYVSASYQHFLAGNDDECAAVDDAVEAKFQRRDEETQSDVERIKKAMQPPCSFVHPARGLSICC